MKKEREHGKVRKEEVGERRRENVDRKGGRERDGENK